MNRAESITYEPNGAGWLWTVRALMQPPKPAPDPHRDFPRRGAGPKISAPYSIAMWTVICSATRPITRSAWLKRAGIPPGYEKQLCNQAIKNLVSGKWVREYAGGKFGKAK